jgi:hypothetical protein
MRKFIYQSITDKLSGLKDTDNRSVIRHSGIWNSKSVSAGEEEPEQTFDMPAVFVEFQPIQWVYQGSGILKATVTVALHIITGNAPVPDSQPAGDSEAGFFDLPTLICRHLHGHAKTAEKFRHDAFISTQSITDHEAGTFRNDVEMFTCRALDASAVPEHQGVAASVRIRDLQV